MVLTEVDATKLAAAPSASLRERKKSATRHALRLATLELVAERGFHAVTVEDIASAAGVSVRTFFNYFPSKDAAVVGLEPDRIGEIRAELVGRLATEPPFAAVRATIVDEVLRKTEPIGDDLERHEWLRRLHAVRSDPDLLNAFAASQAIYESVISEAIAATLDLDPAYDFYPSLVAATAVGAARTAMLAWCASDGQRSLVECMYAAFDALAGGLEPPEGGAHSPTAAQPADDRGTPTEETS